VQRLAGVVVLAEERSGRSVGRSVGVGVRSGGGVGVGAVLKVETGVV
jgi:hypothetical protein